MLDLVASLLLFFYWIVVCFIRPYKAKRILQQSQIKSILISRGKHYKSGMISQSYIAILAFLVAYLNEIPVFGQIYVNYKISLFALGFLILNMLLIEPMEWKSISDQIKQRIGNYSPHTTKERFIWIAVSLVTAVGQEILYRAVFFGIFYKLTNNFWVAGLISAILFTMAHWGYGLASMPSTFFVALGLQYFVKISDGLYIAIAIHFFHNLANGIIYGEIWKRRLKAENDKEMTPDDAEIPVTALEPD